MKVDINRVKTLAFVMTTIAAAAFAWTGCDSSDDDEHAHAGGNGHTSPYPACNAITSACHEVDVGEGEIHECHDKAHAAKSDSDCTGIEERCVDICGQAKADAGASHEGDEEHDGGH